MLGAIFTNMSISVLTQIFERNQVVSKRFLYSLVHNNSDSFFWVCVIGVDVNVSTLVPIISDISLRKLPLYNLQPGSLGRIDLWASSSD